MEEMRSMEIVTGLVKDYIMDKYNVDTINQDTDEYFNYFNILQILKGYVEYGYKTWSGILSNSDDIIRQADNVLDVDSDLYED